METTQVLEQLLSLGTAWEITQVTLNDDAKRIDIKVNYKLDNYLHNGISYKLCYLSAERKWQHLP